MAHRPAGILACGGCRFFLKQDNPIVGQPVQGTCHRHPPSAITLPMGAGPRGVQLGNFTTWPTVVEDAGCGEWQPPPAG